MSTPEIAIWQLRARFASALSTMSGAALPNLAAGTEAGAIGHHVHDPYNLYDATAQESPA